jgi:hypothetical protein
MTTTVGSLAPVVPIHTRGPRRRLDVLHPAMASRFTALVAAVAPAVEGRLSPNVLANRVAFSSADPPLLALHGWRSERRRFAERLHAYAASASALLFTDVARCYGSIGSDVVGDALSACGVADLLIRRIVAMVGVFPRVGVAGLPVGPNASAVLANAVLSAVDAALDGAGLRWLRWVDDIVVALDDDRAADEALAAVDAALASLRLERNRGKTRVVAPPIPAGIGVSSRA